MIVEYISVDVRDWPICHKCQMSVEQFDTIVTQDATIFVAQCHMDQERVVIPHSVWDKLDPSNFQMQEAFRE